MQQVGAATLIHFVIIPEKLSLKNLLYSREIIPRSLHAELKTTQEKETTMEIWT